MKKLILIGGAMGVGKTTVMEEMRHQMQKTVFLDGDWCWMQGYDWNFSKENVAMVEDNIGYLLNNFLQNPNFDIVVFTWVLHKQHIHETILNRLKKHAFKLYNISLMADEKSIRARCSGRNQKRGRAVADEEFESQIRQSMERMACYEQLDTVKIDTSDLSSRQVAEKILKMTEIE